MREAPEHHGPGGEAAVWLDFVEQYYSMVEQRQRGEAVENATPVLHATAARLQTATSRVLALTMLTRLAGHPAVARPRHTGEEPGEPGHSPVVRTLNPRAAAVLTYIEEQHSRSSCRLEEIAKELRVSRSYLSRLVLRETGSTFNRHLQVARMNTASRLLQSSQFSIKEISSATGYEHVPSFDRQFQRHFRMTPGQFRRGIRV
jgi:AraC-like DNA-binding protein